MKGEKKQDAPSQVTVLIGRIEDFIRKKIEACEKAKVGCTYKGYFEGQEDALREVLKFVGRE